MINSPPVTPTSPLAPLSPYDSGVVSPAPSPTATVDDTNPPSPVRNTRSPKDKAKRDRNNLASQKSRLKKKMQFQQMEQRIAELEKENRLLRRKLNSLRA